MNYTERDKCIFCNSITLETYFKNDYNIPISSYSVEKYNTPIIIPFNVLKCNKCKTYQTKYLGDLNIIYSINHADACGSIRSNMMQQFSDMIFKNKDCKNILEIGAGNGILSDILLEKKNYNYNIIDPSYFGNLKGKNVIKGLFEEINIDNLEIDTIIISHVFEHFYEPLKILEKIKNSNVKYVYLNFPDLESYVEDGTYHLLNPEHTYYIENKYLIDIFHNNFFELSERVNFERHSVFLSFIKNNDLIIKDNITNINSESAITLFYENLFNRISNINGLISNYNKDIYLWPCSIHSIYLIMFGLNFKRIRGFIDNSVIKIGKYLYGYDKLCYTFNDIKSDDLIIINGGCFNKEINRIKENTNINYI